MADTEKCPHCGEPIEDVVTVQRATVELSPTDLPRDFIDFPDVKALVSYQTCPRCGTKRCIAISYKLMDQAEKYLNS
jgi:uncharacterized protein (UPF0212 family)